MSEIESKQLANVLRTVCTFAFLTLTEKQPPSHYASKYLGPSYAQSAFNPRVDHVNHPVESRSAKGPLWAPPRFWAPQMDIHRELNPAAATRQTPRFVARDAGSRSMGLQPPADAGCRDYKNKHGWFAAKQRLRGGGLIHRTQKHASENSNTPGL